MSKPWTDEELIVSCWIYRSSDLTDNQKTKQGMKILGRDYNSMSYRIGNLKYLKYREGGYKNGGPKLEKIWNQFESDEKKMFKLAREIVDRGLVGPSSISDIEETEETDEYAICPGGNVLTTAKRRKYQNKLRKAVLEASNHRCCITGIEGDDNLIASHIKPWEVCSPKEMTCVRNALCLNPLHDKLFDKFRMTINMKMDVFYDPKLKDEMPPDIYETMITKCTKVVNSALHPDYSRPVDSLRCP